VVDLDALTSWNSDWRGLKGAVLGLGVTGFAAADTLIELAGTLRHHLQAGQVVGR
jgi:UDP-N-acetylmuramoylalanine--D-glutamate ligase